jgi:hypothetical protein
MKVDRIPISPDKEEKRVIRAGPGAPHLHNAISGRKGNI